MTKRFFAWLGIIILLLTLSPRVSLAANENGEPNLKAAKMQQELEQQLVCQDSCGMLVSACDNATAEYMRKVIKEQIAAGNTKEQIIAHFVNIYGEQVLAAPPKKGFNLTAWVTPFAFVLVGGIIIYTMLDKWVFINRLEEADNDSAQTEAASPEIELYQEKLAEELKKRW